MGEVPLTANQIPPHSHPFLGQEEDVGSTAPLNRSLGIADEDMYAEDAPGNRVNMHASTLDQTGGNFPHNNMQPYLTMNFIIALVGTYPSRN